MSNKCEYLLELGYSEKQIEKFRESWAESIISFLEENSAEVYANMRYLLDDFDREFLLKLTVVYSDTFVMYTESFLKKFERLKTEFPEEYVNIVEKQFWGYEGFDTKYVTIDMGISNVDYKPFMEIMSFGDERVCEAIESLKRMNNRVFKFIIMLNKGIGIEISAQDVPENWLLDLEVCKWEVFKNAEYLIDQGMSKEMIADILWYCPSIMINSVSLLQDTLVDYFGENYIEVMKSKVNDDDWGDVLCKIC